MTKKSIQDEVWFEINQIDYINKLTQIPNNSDFDKFRSSRACISWACHSRPDICCAVNRLCRVAEKNFERRHVRALNKLCRRIQGSKDIVLKYQKLNLANIHIPVYSSAFFASNIDSSSQLGYIIMLADESGTCHTLSYCSKKSKKIVRSIMVSEVFAFSAALDHAYVIFHDLQTISDQPVPLTMLTDSKQLFEVITRAAHTTEKRLMVEIMAARKAYNRHEI